MKNKTILLLLLFLYSLTTLSQAPNKFQYQLYVKNAAGTALITNATVGVRIRITNAAGTIDYYTEDHLNKVTNAAGQVVLTIGSGTQVGTNTFASLNWKSNNYYIRFATKMGTATQFSAFSTTPQLLSVPYALYANSASNQIVSILDYGADPASGIQDDTKKIQKAIDENPGKTILFPAGNYLITSSLKINSSVQLIGEANEKTEILAVNTKAFEVNSTAQGASIKDMIISGYGSTSNTEGIICSGSSNITLKNLTLQFFLNNAIILSHTKGTVLDNLKVRTIGATDTNLPDFKNGILIQGFSTSISITNSSINAKEKSIAILTLNAQMPEGIMIDNTTISNGVLSTASYGIYSNSVKSLHVLNSNFVNTGGTNLYLIGSEGLLFENNQVLSGGWNNISNRLIILENCTKNEIINNNFNCLKGNTGIYTRNSNNTIISGNIIEMGATPYTSVNHINLSGSSYYNIISNNILRWGTSLTSNPSPVIYNNVSASANNVSNAVAPTFNIIYSNILQK